MSIQIAWCSPCTFVVVFCVMLKPSQSQVCSTEKMENITIDIKAAFSKGIRGTDPIHAASWEACVNVCCLDIDKKCNYVVFDTRRKGNNPNCYLFYYPTNETCPVKQVLGLVTYRMIEDAEVPMSAPSSVKLSHPIVNGKFLSPLTAMFDPHSTTSHPHGSGLLQKPTASKRMEIVSHLDKINGHSQLPKGERANGSENLNYSSMHELNSLLSPRIANSIPPVIPIVQPTAKLPTVTTGTQASTIAAVIPDVSSRNATTTMSTTAYHRNTHVATINPERSTTVPNPSTTSGSNASGFSPLLSIKISSASLHNVHLSNGQLGLEGYVLNGAPSKKRASHFGDKSILTAALLFGVIFLLLVTVMVGRKMLESFWQRRYTRLDYLINGMYANL
ncbi:MANSC domain-containing protein 1 [Rhineura floridana]|uniref:MANSC domain-containing protein 1 n=1 Tax=Rhineura floridana TaxID=261503 RepID=UPI002AC812B2|nr:MANSC domain-containing protein 1 [Rhineura floridana]XP_061438488.1 MANSC domain-containing protein 1 [Rhineura floridana]XP_061438489.1 MANSC domain-containing protein 1 [Rhineura floridana]XP_061438490.1 MANSC domain-containing protein 1 [Rhineura floridana]